VPGTFWKACFPTARGRPPGRFRRANSIDERVARHGRFEFIAANANGREFIHRFVVEPEPDRVTVEPGDAPIISVEDVEENGGKRCQVPFGKLAFLPFLRALRGALRQFVQISGDSRRLETKKCV